jgi:hypothetical protein
LTVEEILVDFFINFSLFLAESGRFSLFSITLAMLCKLVSIIIFSSTFRGFLKTILPGFEEDIPVVEIGSLSTIDDFY